MSEQQKSQESQEATPVHNRQKYIGGSDIASVLGISPWRTPMDLWEDKIKPPVDNANKMVRRARQRGHRWEAAVAEMLVEELTNQGHTVEIVASNKRYIDPAVGFFACEIDFEIRLNGAEEITNVELKTVHPFKAKEWGESGTDSAPLWYVAQAMWGLGITGRRECLIAPMFGADEIKVFPIQRDEETIAAMRARAENFWNSHVLPKIPPEPINSKDIDTMFRQESEAALLADDELTLAVLRMRAIDKEIKARTAEYDELEFKVKMMMKDAPELLLGDTSAVTWKTRNHTYLDQAALKEDHPKLFKEYTVKGQSRVFTLKSFGWKGTE